MGGPLPASEGAERGGAGCVQRLRRRKQNSSRSLSGVACIDDVFNFFLNCQKMCNADSLRDVKKGFLTAFWILDVLV